MGILFILFPYVEATLMFPRRAKFFIQFDDPALYTGHQVRFILSKVKKKSKYSKTQRILDIDLVVGIPSTGLFAFLM